MKLNEDQKIVLEEIKKRDGLQQWPESPFEIISTLEDEFVECEGYTDIPEVLESYEKMNGKQQFEVLQAYAEWGLK